MRPTHLYLGTYCGQKIYQMIPPLKLEGKVRLEPGYFFPKMEQAIMSLTEVLQYAEKYDNGDGPFCEHCHEQLLEQEDNVYHKSCQEEIDETAYYGSYKKQGVC